MFRLYFDLFLFLAATVARAVGCQLFLTNVIKVGCTCVSIPL